jgi:queuine tRNA-ribosyltransferase
MSLRFEITSSDGPARCGVLTTPHGEVSTPAFMPVGTLGAVKGVPPWELIEAGAEILLANLYHLALRPGIEAIEELGGLHVFCGWDRPMLTDSGGFQVFSLASLRAIDDHGVTFRSHLDGASLRFTPENVVEWQRRLGVDVAMVLDECLPWPVEGPKADESVARTGEWARRSREAWGREPGAGGLFGIVQGGVFPELRARAARQLAAMDFDGYAIGGVAVGEPDEERRRAIEETAPQLPAAKPRYLMGVGTPADIAHAVAAGVDLFDCVLPTRNARHGVLFTRRGPLRIKNASFQRDERPIDEACGCRTCTTVSRALVHHLLRSKEITGMVLATVHNLRFYLDFMGDLREAIASGRLSEVVAGAGSTGPDAETPSSGLSGSPPSGSRRSD